MLREIDAGDGCAFGCCGALVGGIVGGVVAEAFFGTKVALFGALKIGAILGFALFGITYLASGIRQYSKRLREEDRQRRDALSAECSRLTVMLDQSRSTFLTLPEWVGAADTHLDKAEQEFSEGLFAPFWDEVEHAANMLGAYHQGITSINGNAQEYSVRKSALSVPIPEFSMPATGLPDARLVAARLSAIVRRGQKDFHFATIYEQRKTNQLLYSGFQNLAAGIAGMEGAITSALDNLSSSMGGKLDLLVRSADVQADLISTLTDRVVSSDDKQRRFEKDMLSEGKKQSEMLDNIQRDRKPFP